MKFSTFALSAFGAIAVSACVAGPRIGPVEVTRFHSAQAQLGTGTIFIESAPGMEGEDSDPVEAAAFKSAIAAELTELGYREVPRAQAQQIAQVRINRYVAQAAQRRSPVSVGAGGSAGSYGSGVGLGIGINLGGGKRGMIGTDIAVMIRDAGTGDAVWEGRASISVSDNSQLADNGPNAKAIADALFSEFPGNNGETVEVRVAN